MKKKIKNNKNTAKSPNLKELKSTIIDLCNATVKPVTFKDICSELQVKDKIAKHQTSFIIKNLVIEGAIKEIGHGKYGANTTQEYYEGKIEKITSGAGYVICDGMEQDVFVSARNAGQTLGGDIVRIVLTGNHTGKNPEGVVVSIVKRGRTTFVGNMRVDARHSFMTPDNSRIGTDFYVPKDKLNGAKDGDKVLVTLLDWPKKAKSPFAEVTTVIGAAGEHNAEIHAILAEFGLPYEFPESVEAYVESIPETISEEEISKRRDMREVLTFTIDPHDAKDFDDALSIQKLADDKWEIGIHIADVSHYVQEGTLLNDEAYERATSVYLVDRVVPMLPEKLSNKVCSLRPNEEKLCFSAIFTINDKAEVLDEWFGRTVIYSDHRFTYEDAQEVIENKEGKFAEEILLMDKLAKIMRAKRIDEGAITFDRVEVKFQLDEEKNPTGVYFKQAKDANKLIEEYMLLANRKVASFIGKAADGTPSNKPFVYRIHDDPDPEKINNFSTFVNQFGHQMNLQTPKEIANSMNRVLADVSGKREENMVELLAIRTMSKAKYTIENIGHYGLGFDYYSHFTSPIRRWPDVMVHRLLQRYLDGEKVTEKEAIEEQCKHSSAMEKLSTDAERSSIKYMQVKYLMGKVGQDFMGSVSGVTEFGMFIELKESLCEGLVSMRDLKDDHYELHKETFSLVGKRTKKRFQLGDALKVRVRNVDLVKKQIDFQLVK
ncbi:MAG: ribonuclease R [Flavobacteriales bacterium]|jgi:ribonuclease R|tara:strand:- start:3029 stop:5176 length:2148 start_codon:yes stop_codon:yes gene_type:complete